MFNQLAQKCQEQQQLYAESISNLEYSLDNLESTVNLTQRSLLNANNTLDIATDQLKEYKKNKNWNNFAMIGSGAAIGLLVGVLIAN